MPFRSETVWTAVLTSPSVRETPPRRWARTAAPAFAAASAPFWAPRCWANALPPSMTSATPARRAMRPRAKSGRIWPRWWGECGWARIGEPLGLLRALRRRMGGVRAAVLDAEDGLGGEGHAGRKHDLGDDRREGVVGRLEADDRQAADPD